MRERKKECFVKVSTYFTQFTERVFTQELWFTKQQLSTTLLIRNTYQSHTRTSMFELSTYTCTSTYMYIMCTIVHLYNIQWNLHYKGHLGSWHLVHYIEVVLSVEVQNVLSRYEVLHLGPWDHLGGFIYCALYTECPLRDVPLYYNGRHWSL